MRIHSLVLFVFLLLMSLPDVGLAQGYQHFYKGGKNVRVDQHYSSGHYKGGSGGGSSSRKSSSSSSNKRVDDSDPYTYGTSAYYRMFGSRSRSSSSSPRPQKVYSRPSYSPPPRQRSCRPVSNITTQIHFYINGSYSQSLSVVRPSVCGHQPVTVSAGGSSKRIYVELSAYQTRKRVDLTVSY